MFEPYLGCVLFLKVRLKPAAADVIVIIESTSDAM